MKKLLALLFFFGTMGLMVSCDDDEIPVVELPVEDMVKSGSITADETWTSDRIYELDGRVVVEDGVILTIEAGAIIKGREGNGTLASALIVERGGKLMAIGTPNDPIIFTSTLDEISIGGAYVGNLTKTDNEKWGGLILLGKAHVSAKTGDTEASIEGLPADQDYSKYGAASAAEFVNDDNSGTLKYVSIRHGGITIGEGNEINGLTLGGVGSGTTIDNIEIFATLDDGIEFFGGTVNVTNALVYWQGDDGIDIDQNYSGTVDNFVVSHGDKVGTDEGLEIDGPESVLKDGKFTLKNGSVMSDGVDGTAADLKSDAQGTIQNVIFSGYGTGDAIIKIEAEYSTGDCSIRSSAAGQYGDAFDHLLTGDLVIANSTAEGVKLYSKKDDTKQPLCDAIPTEDVDAAAEKFTSSTAATGADRSVFSWTATVASGVTL